MGEIFVQAKHVSMLGRRGMKLELAVADWKDWLCSWELEDKTDREAENSQVLFVAAIAEDFIFREGKTARARLWAL